MIETSIELTDGEVSGNEIQRILNFGREMLEAPIELLPHTREVIEELSQKPFRPEGERYIPFPLLHRLFGISQGGPDKFLPNLYQLYPHGVFPVVQT